jgi:hypothetical protein
LERALPDDHPHLMRGLESYAALLDELGRGGEAAGLHARAEAIRRRRDRSPTAP